jgi:hypothetical protein
MLYPFPGLGVNLADNERRGAAEDTYVYFIFTGCVTAKTRADRENGGEQKRTE